MTNETASAVKALTETTPGIGYNLWNRDSSEKFAELRPSDNGMFTMKFLPDVKSKLGSTHYVTSDRALSIVRENVSLGRTMILWACCACGDKETSKALRDVSHGYCISCAAKFRADILALK